MRLLTYQTADGPAAAIQVDETPADLVAWLSRTVTLLPGDIIATGTPAGVGAAQGRFLRDGDTVEVEIDGLGTLVNPVRSE